MVQAIQHAQVVEHEAPAHCHRGRAKGSAHVSLYSGCGAACRIPGRRSPVRGRAGVAGGGGGGGATATGAATTVAVTISFHLPH